MQLFTPPTLEVPSSMPSCWRRKPDFRRVPLQKQKTGLCRSEGCLSWLDHGWLCQRLCRGCEALSGVRCLRRRHGTNRNTDRKRAEKIRDSSQYSAVHPAGKLCCEKAPRHLPPNDGDHGQNGGQESCKKERPHAGGERYAEYDAVRRRAGQSGKSKRCSRLVQQAAIRIAGNGNAVSEMRKRNEKRLSAQQQGRCIQFCSGSFSEKKRQHILTAGFRCFEKGGIKI